MKKRIIIFTLLAIMLLTVGGVFALWHRRRSRGPRLISRARIALSAGKFKKALDLAESYIAKRPKDWRGSNVLGRIYMRQGRYSEARDAFKRSAELDPTQVQPHLGWSNTYFFPARRTINANVDDITIKELKHAIGELVRANEILTNFKTSDAKLAIDIHESIGHICYSMAPAWELIAKRLDREAWKAETTRKPELADDKQTQSADAQKEADQASHQATEELMKVINADPTRPRAARSLVELCLKSDDKALIEAARKAVMSCDQPLPIPTLMFAKYDLDKSLANKTPSEQRRQREKFCEQLDRLLVEHNDLLEIKLARADCALTLEDYDAADRLCAEILKDSQDDYTRGWARLIDAKIKFARGLRSDAEGLLLELSTDYQDWPDAYVALAHVSLANGKSDQARNAMRKVTLIDPDNAVAWSYLAQTLLREGVYKEAFKDASEFYRAHREDPNALTLLVQAAMRERPQRIVQAKKAIVEAAENFGDDAQMLLMVGNGYNLLRDTDKAQEAFVKAAACKGESVGQRLAIARALLLNGQAVKGENILLAELKRDVNQPQVCYELGRFYSDTERPLQAIEQFRSAIRMDEQDKSYRLALAEALFNIGALTECLRMLGESDPYDTEGNFLRLRAKLALGIHADASEMLRLTARAQQGGLTLAMTYLQNGRPRQCMDVCIEKLNKDPENDDIRFLLGQSYLAQGDLEKCVQAWQRVLKARPFRLPIYIRIADVLSKDLNSEDIRKRLTEMRGARSIMVDLAIAWQHADKEQFEEAAQIYARLKNRSDVTDSFKNRVSLLEARALASAGKIDKALSELGKIDQPGLWRNAAQEARVEILISSGRTDKARKAINGLAKLFDEEKDSDSLGRVVEFYSRTGDTETALSVCDRIESLSPGSAKAPLLRAGVLSSAGRTREIPAVLEEAISRRPGRLVTYAALARALDAAHEPRKALAAIDRMQEIGPAGQAMALLERGGLFASWGLHDRAAKCFEQLAKRKLTGEPLKLSLGLALKRMEHKASALSVLEQISNYSAQYPPARQAMANLAETPEQKLAILDELTQIHPARASVLEQKMRVLISAGRNDEAVTVFEAFVAPSPGRLDSSSGAARLAIDALLASGRHNDASALATRVARHTSMPAWRRLAVLLNPTENKLTEEMLPAPTQAGLHDAAVGLIAASQQADEEQIRIWAKAISRLQGKPARYHLLSSLVAGRKVDEKTLNSVRFGSNASRELVLNGKHPAEAALLLRSELAADMGLTQLGAKQALDVLRNRPRCQWAGLMLIRTRADLTVLQEARRTLQPANCPAAQQLAAAIFTAQGEFAKAADAYARAGKTEKNFNLLMMWALAAERAERGERARELYAKVWRETSLPAAANNAAAVTCHLYPKDKLRLSEALLWAQSAVQASPKRPEFKATCAWVHFLLGQNDQARSLARQAIKGMSNSIQAHYHLGVIELSTGDADLGRMHLKAAIGFAEAAKTNGERLSPSDSAAIREANKALVDTNTTTKASED